MTHETILGAPAVRAVRPTARDRRADSIGFVVGEGDAEVWSVIDGGGGQRRLGKGDDGNDDDAGGIVGGGSREVE